MTNDDPMYLRHLEQALEMTPLDAMKQALEALNCSMQICDEIPNRCQKSYDPVLSRLGQMVNHGKMPDGTSCFGYYDHVRDAITNLRTAIEQMEKVEPINQRYVEFALHYPECWDDVNYPTVWDALMEVTHTFKCSNQDTHPVPAIPPGWKLVPVEPTEEMHKAFYKAFDESGNPVYGYDQMLNAAPTPEGEK